VVLALTAGVAGLLSPPLHAQSASRTNVATIAAPAGANDIDPANNTGRATVTLAAANAYSFCPAPHGTAPSNAIYGVGAGGNIRRLEAGASSDVVVPELALPSSVTGQLNALMIDRSRDRMLVHTPGALWAFDSANGGWYAATTTNVSSDFPRGGFDANGVGYMVRGNSVTPEVVRIQADATGFGYTATPHGNLSYDVAPTNNSSGDLAFDGDGQGWLVAGQDIYRVDFINPNPVAVRQARPLFNGSPVTWNWAGAAFGPDGLLYLGRNDTGYYRYDPATGAVTAVATLPNDQSRDLASCAFPVPPEAELGVVKSLAQVNGVAYVPGSPVSAGDVLTYAITLGNTGAAVGTLYPGNVLETVPANTTYVAAGNAFTQAAGAQWTIASAVNVPAGGNAVLNFVVRVNDPLPAGVTSVANNVTFAPGEPIDCADPDNTCSVTTPVGPNIATTKTSNPATGSNVNPGQTITYTLGVVVSNASTTAPLTLTDTLGAGLGFGAVTNAGAFACNAANPLVCTLPAGTPTGSYAVTYTATVDAGVSPGTTVANSVATDPTNNGGDANPGCPVAAPCTTEHIVVAAPNLVIAKTGPASAAVGAPYAYQIVVTNDGGTATTADATVSDVVPAGLTIDSATGCTIAGQSVTCIVPAGLSNVAPNNTASFTINVTPQASTAGTTVTNVASVTGGGDPDCVAAGDCVSPPVDTTIGAPNLVIAKSGPANATVGTAYDYVLTVTNTGSAATTAPATVSDTLPTGLAINTAGGCTFAGLTATCAVPTGLAVGDSASFTINVTPQASTAGTTVTNVASVTGGGDPDCVAAGDCVSPPVDTTIGAPNLVIAKSGPANATVGVAYAYTLTVTNTGVSATADATVIDTVPAGLTINSVVPGFCAAAGQNVTCTIPQVDLAVGASPVVITINVTPQASTAGTTVTNVASVTGGGDPDCVAAGDCVSPPVDTQVARPLLTFSKSSDPVSGGDVEVGQVITYTLSVTVAAAPTLSDVVLTDTVGAGLGNLTVTSPGVFTGGFTGSTGTFTLASGAAPGTYAVVYTATVQPDAGTTVDNSVQATGGNPPPGSGQPPAPQPTCDPACATEHAVARPAVAVVKTANPLPGTDVAAGDVITYGLTVAVANASLLSDVVLTDTLGAGLTFGSVTSAGAFTCGGVNPLVCTLPAGTAPGSYALQYTATVDASADTTVRNDVQATGGNDPLDPDNPQPDCTSCSTEHDVVAPTISVTKSSTPGSGNEVRVGDTLAYTLTVTVANSATRDVLTLTDTLGAGLTFGAVTDAGAFSCSGVLVCTLPAGTAAGTYPVTYTATVDPDATRIVRNVVTATGGTGNSGSPPTCASCDTEHLLAAPRVLLAKSATPGAGAQVSVGDVIEYTLTVTIENSATLAEVRLTDTPGAGLALGAMPAGCAMQGATAVCTLPAGTVPGLYTFTYPATVTADANGQVRNVVAGSGGGGDAPECTACETAHELVDDAQLRIVKAAAVRNAKVGDLVRYTLTVENVGAVNISGATVVDTPPAGFTYVEGSMAVADRDNEFTLAGKYPLRIDGLDIDAGARATIVYLLRVGAGVKPGVHVNQAVALNDTGTPISNIATAQVTLDGDPLLDDSLVFGTVFDDRDGDGWQDRADLTDVRVQGGFAPSAYIAGSTTIDRGDGPQPVADASAPLLHGIDVGAIAARQSEGDPVDAHRVTIRQRLASADFTDDFVLTSAQGVTVHMDAAGSTTLVRSGEAGKGLNAAEPTVQRVVSAVDGGFELAYVISNAGIDERGLPGVRIASVEGLLIETDQYGRYHLVDVHGGDWAHGRNFLLKVDSATLPAGAEFTTENPRVRRVTPGIPVRFDFGVKQPVQVLEGGARKVELELGEVIFAPASAEVREAYLPAIRKMAEQVDAHRGGDIVIVADGSSQALAIARAAAVRGALEDMVDAEARTGLRVVLRTQVDDPHSMVAGIDAGGALLGTVLFDTDKSDIQPGFEALLDAVAERLDAMGGGVVAIVGHTDVRASHAYNTALGLRRATAVQQALAKRLSPEVRARVRVEASSDPAAPVGTERK